MVHNSVDTLISIHFVGFDGFDTILHFVPSLLNPAPLRTQPKPQSEGFFKDFNRHGRFSISYCVFRIFCALRNTSRPRSDGIPSEESGQITGIFRGIKKYAS